jgi:peptidoglycan hydrolase CwlO-like protein
MEWVIAALAAGCLFFVFQVVVDHLRYKAVIAPRIRQLEETKGELEGKIEAARGELNDRRDKLDPLKGEIEQLERQCRDLQRQIEAERVRLKPRLPLTGRGDGRFRAR